jgi:predicted amidophosphoribosyltransferase
VTVVDVRWPLWLIDLLLPRRCVSCGAAADLLCAACFQRLRVLRPPWCSLCGAPTAWPVALCQECAGRRLSFASARAAVAYDGPARALIHGWKERGLRHAADLAVDLVDTHVETPAADMIAYIPPDHDRQLRRGMHPAEGLARELAARWGVEALPLLARVHSVPRQTGRSRVERRQSVRGAFTAPRGAPDTVVLVDDVYTTGSTAAAAASALRTAGTRNVHVVTFARTVR